MEARADNVVRIGALELRFLVDTQTLVMFEFVVPANARVPAPHYHKDVGREMAMVKPMSQR